LKGLERIKGLGGKMVQDLTMAIDHEVAKFLSEAFHMTDKHMDCLQTAATVDQ